MRNCWTGLGDIGSVGAACVSREINRAVAIVVHGICALGRHCVGLVIVAGRATTRVGRIVDLAVAVVVRAVTTLRAAADGGDRRGAAIAARLRLRASAAGGGRAIVRARHAGGGSGVGWAAAAISARLALGGGAAAIRTIAGLRAATAAAPVAARGRAAHAGVDVDIGRATHGRRQQEHDGNRHRAGERGG